MNRYAPCTPSSDHSSVCSGGAANIMNSRAVSAPYCSTSACGSTPLFFDLDIVTMPPDSTGCAVGAQRGADARLPRASVLTSTSAGLKYSTRPAGRFAEIDLVEHHALREQVREWLARPGTSPRSCITRVQKREYSRCRIACSMPPMYWSTGSQ